jgi:hypothetical protein
MKYPCCQDCPFAMKADETSVWCFGAPPTAQHTQVADQNVNVKIYRPLMGNGQIGCGLHPDWPKPRWWLLGRVK